MAPHLPPLLTPPNDGTQKENRLDLRVALKKGAGHVFATVRHRTVRTKGALSQKTAKVLVFMLVQAAAKTWRRLKGANHLPMVIEGVTFTDGVAASDAETRAA